MSVRSQALVPLSTEQQAAWRAVAETEKRRHQGNTLAEYPYAGAFFRCLNGSRRISLSDLRFFMSSRQACHAARYVVARVLRGLFWCLKYTVILPLATMALMALFVLWKDNTTPGKLLVKEINFVRQTAPAGQFPVSECWFSSSDSSGRSEIQDICHYRAADAADYVRETDRSLMQLVTALWATLALMYVSLAAITGKYPVRPGKMKCIRVVTADEHLKEVYTEDASLPGKIRKCPVYLPDDRTNRNNGDKNEHA